MKRTPLNSIPEDLPRELLPYLEGAPLYDSSCSPAARVYYIEKDDGYFLKTAPALTLRSEAELTGYFHRKGLSAEVVAYLTYGKDWMLTRRVPGEDCLDSMYLKDPKRLCDTTAQLLRMLHSTPAADCPVLRTPERIQTALDNARAGRYEASLFPDNWGYRSPEEALAVLEAGSSLLKSDVLIHGDCCLPNILLRNWRFSGFIDLGGGGLGDRHMDLFWGIWSLSFNLKTDRYSERFLDVYGRNDVDPALLRVVGAMEVFS